MVENTISIGATFPNFRLNTVLANNEIVTLTDSVLEGKWSVFFTWPFDFTFVCPTEINGFNKIYADFAQADCQLFGLSIDSEFVHLEWKKSFKDPIKFPWMSDVSRQLSTRLGIIDAMTGATYRATYIIDPKKQIRSISINDLSVGRNPEETLRLVQAFQSGELCGCQWQPGDAYVKVS